MGRQGQATCQVECQKYNAYTADYMEQASTPWEKKAIKNLYIKGSLVKVSIGSINPLFHVGRAN